MVVPLVLRSGPTMSHCSRTTFRQAKSWRKVPPAPAITCGTSSRLTWRTCWKGANLLAKHAPRPPSARVSPSWRRVGGNRWRWVTASHWNSNQTRLNRHIWRPDVSCRSSICSAWEYGFDSSKTSTWVCLKIEYAAKIGHFHLESLWHTMIRSFTSAWNGCFLHIFRQSHMFPTIQTSGLKKNAENCPAGGLLIEIASESSDEFISDWWFQSHNFNASWHWDQYGKNPRNVKPPSRL